jgi:hypothetical protein
LPGLLKTRAFDFFIVHEESTIRDSGNTLSEISEKVAPAAGGIIEEKRQEIRECYVPRASR